MVFPAAARAGGRCLNSDFARPSICVGPQLSWLAEVPVQFEVAGGEQRLLLAVGAVAEFRVIARQGQVPNGVQPFRVDVGGIGAQASRTTPA